MKSDKKIFRIKYLFLGALLLTLLVTGVHIYFLVQQFDKTNRLTQIMLDESLSLSISKYHAEQLYVNQSGKRSEIKLMINNSFGTPGDTTTSNKVKVINQQNTTAEKGKPKHFEYMWSSEPGNNASELMQSFLLLINKSNQLTSVNLIHLDSIYVQTLYEKGLSIDHTMQLVNIKTKRVLLQTDSLLAQYNSQSLQTGSLRPITYDKSIQIIFKNPNQVVLKQMGGTIIVSALMLIFTVSFLFYYLYIISKQKKIESVREDFVHSMTHELRNPLQSAIALSEMLGNENVQNNKLMYNDVVNRVSRNLSDLNSQIETLLTLSLSDKQQTEIQIQENNLSEMLEDVVNTYTIIAEKPVRFMLCINPNPCICRYNATHLTNAVKNLIDNALKYSNDEVEINITASKSEDRLTIQVKDNGIGIPAGCISKIFDQYYRVSPLKRKIKINGFGLGLSYVKWVVAIHNGVVHANSKEGVGSTFTIEIPV